ncbi:hypothetical protein [Humibacillus xanthopallidus]|uniref:hypothetical protein n=1 Tax=Humibacillus xanthopallidus TaxID=412689 RepID=UPI001639E7FC|nr:hypothetical protein [Humibacillus xanthopallidus]
MAPSLAGAGAFWLANLVISLTPVASDYRSALSIEYGSMLLEAAVGGLVVSVAVTLVLVRFPRRIRGDGPVRKALTVAACALAVVTVFVEVPSKLLAGVDDPLKWLIVATAINAVRVLAMGLAIGVVMWVRRERSEHRPMRAGKERKP